METRHYTVILEKEEDGGSHAFCPALKGCHTQGDTIEEALANARLRLLNVEAFRSTAAITSSIGRTNL
ncbi:MAG: type II toxin-antitoxin system HicB family antitoxin [Chloroflexi bacterium]|nr:type II toxin-antitoxin system HicB family antitoxin [Chloroflexota bacterium]